METIIVSIKTNTIPIKPITFLSRVLLFVSAGIILALEVARNDRKHLVLMSVLMWQYRNVLLTLPLSAFTGDTGGVDVI